jgi:sRNA-binding regulator protein Hfq
MAKKLLLLILAFFISSPNVLPARAQSGAEKQGEELSKIRSKVAKRGVGPKAKVKITLVDGTKLQGYVSEARADSFTVTDAKTGGSVVVEYSQVKQLKGEGLSKGAKIALVVGIAVVAFTVIIGAVNAALDD